MTARRFWAQVRTAMAGRPITRVASPAAVARPRESAVPTEYLGLYKYLAGRYADTVVLTFQQIEDLLGSALPDLARHKPDWWANPTADMVMSAQAHSWTEASRTATPNLGAQHVVFVRA